MDESTDTPTPELAKSMRLTTTEIRAMMKSAVMNFLHGKTSFDTYTATYSRLGILLTEAEEREQNETH